MEKKLNINDSKKLIIGISILFCTIILIIGGTFAFFTQSDTKEMGNIVTTDINGTLLYNDKYEENEKYNRQGLIPASIDVVLNTYKSTDTENKCLDMNNYSSCSVYRFSIKNTAEVVQQLVMTLNPTANSYNNLKFILFEIKDNNPEQISKKPVSLEKGNYLPIQLIDNFILNSNEERIYELVFYIENQDYAQDDAGKQFGAGISINSITTGFNITKQYGTTCWEVDPDDSSKLIAFNGINHDTSITSFKDSVVESCSGYVDADEEGFIVTIPSTFNNVEIKTIGNMLLNPVIRFDASGVVVNKNISIKKIIIQDGIERIDDGDISTQKGSFFGLGADFNNKKADPTKTLEVKFPNSLTYIGNAAFSLSAIRELNLPSNLTYIGDFSFYLNTNLTTTKDKPLVIPVSVETIGLAAFTMSYNLSRVKFETNNGNSALKTIESGAFSQCNLTYTEDVLVIPSNVEYIGDGTFANNGDDSNPMLEYIEYKGNFLNEFDNNWYSISNTLLNPNG